MELIYISTTLAAVNNRQIIATTRGHEILMDIRKERNAKAKRTVAVEFEGIVVEEQKNSCEGG